MAAHRKFSKTKHYVTSISQYNYLAVTSVVDNDGKSKGRTHYGCTAVLSNPATRRIKTTEHSNMAASTSTVCSPLQNEGIDFLEISGENFETPVAYKHSSKKDRTVAREAYFLDYARDLKVALDIPVIVTGGFRSRDIMNGALTDDCATDLIGMGRPFIIDPEFPKKLLDGDTDLSVSVNEGHDRYLESIDLATELVLKTRSK